MTVWQSGGVDLDVLKGYIEAEFERLDRLLSNYRSDSFIERFSRAETTEPVVVGEEIVTWCKRGEWSARQARSAMT